MMQPSEMAILVFDSQCVLCDGGVRYTLKHEKRASIRFVAIQSSKGQALAFENDLDPEDPSSFLFIEHGRALQKSDAVIAMSAHLNGLARMVSLTKILPKVVRDFLYGLVAKHRYRIFGRLDACMMPSAEQEGRFSL